MYSSDRFTKLIHFNRSLRLLKLYKSIQQPTARELNKKEGIRVIQESLTKDLFTSEKSKKI